MRIFQNLNKIQVLDERFYTLDRETYYPSVTTVLSAYPKNAFFYEWLKNNGKNSDTILKEAGEQGSKVHNAIEDFLKGKEIMWFVDGKEQYTLKEWQMITRFMEFYKTLVTSFNAVEVQVFSKKHKIGGTIDLICTIDNERWMIDFKTSKAMYKTYEMQLAIYKEVWEEQTKIKIDRYGVLWLNAATRTKKDLQGIGWQIKEYTKNHNHNLKLYQATRMLWDEENPNYKPKNLEYLNSYRLKPEKTQHLVPISTYQYLSKNQSVLSKR